MERTNKSVSMFLLRVTEIIVSDTFGNESKQAVIGIIDSCRDDTDGKYKFHYLMYRIVDHAIEYMIHDNNDKVEKLYEIFNFYKSELDTEYMKRIGRCYVQYDKFRITDKDLYINFCFDMYYSGIQFSQAFRLVIPEKLSYFIDL